MHFMCQRLAAQKRKHRMLTTIPGTSKSSRRKTKDFRSFLPIPLFSDLSHHRTCRSAYGGSLHSVHLNIVVQQAGVTGSAKVSVAGRLLHYAAASDCPISLARITPHISPVRLDAALD